MNRLLDAFWRAAAYCLHPRVVWLSLLPLVISAGLCVLLGWLFWEPAVAGVRRLLENWSLVETFLGWLSSVGAERLREMLAPLLVVALAVPVIVVVSLLLVAVLMTPAVVKLVAARRFPALERRHGASFWASAGWSLGCTLLALLLIVVSIPLWLVPPLVLVLPPLIWGWLTYRVMSFDTLAEHASRDERRALLRRHRWPLFAMGVLTGYLGAAPSLLWAVSATMLIFAPIIVVVAIWLYTLVFAFSALWFAHFLLAALHDWRSEHEPLIIDAAPALPPLPSRISSP
jgi:hypothetical protein